MNIKTEHEWPDQLGNEFHDLQELVLNADLRTGELRGSWGNLGYWSQNDGVKITHYSDAAQQLAQKLGEFACLEPDSTLLDVGFGCGDQLTLWQQAFSVQLIYGINLSVIQTQYAQRKVSEQNTENTIHLYQGNACDSAAWKDLPKSFDRIIALDCVYHFSNKASFLALCANHFKSTDDNAQLVLSDLILTKPIKCLYQKAFLKIICYFSHIPFNNFKTRTDYEKQLASLGLELIEFNNISSSVMMPFSDWVFKTKKESKQIKGNQKRTPWLKRTAWIKYVGTALFLRWASKNDIFQYAFLRIGAKNQ
jgi:cyclopropane fatty-acyl-phospholipid synthase-like methyltransferase